MNSGRLKYKITLNLVSFVQDTAFGSQRASNVPVIVWADMRFVKAKERVDGGIRESLQDAVFKIRYSSDVSAISERDNISFESITYDINAISYGGQSNREYIEILAQARN
tara:strand:- start:1051 stop:1380 length:330 start_codon:yes stop_codon:yes gene_type:complete